MPIINNERINSPVKFGIVYRKVVVYWLSKQIVCLHRITLHLINAGIIEIFVLRIKAHFCLFCNSLGRTHCWLLITYSSNQNSSTGCFRDDSRDSRVLPHGVVLIIKRQVPTIDATVLIMNCFLILSFASANALNFQRFKRSSKICDFDNPDVPMSTDVENSLSSVADDDYYRYDYYYPSRHYSYNVTGRIENSWSAEYPDNIEPVWTNRGACKREEISKVKSL